MCRLAYCLSRLACPVCALCIDTRFSHAYYPDVTVYR